MNPLIFVILIIMVIFTIYHFWQDISDFWNTGGTFAEGFSATFNPVGVKYCSSYDSFKRNKVAVSAASPQSSLKNNCQAKANELGANAFATSGKRTDFNCTTYQNCTLSASGADWTRDGQFTFYKKADAPSAPAAPAPPAPAAPAAPAPPAPALASGTIELNEPLKNNHELGTSVKATGSSPSSNTVVATDDKGNITTTTTQQSSKIDPTTGAQVQEKCITVSQLNSASAWVDHLFGTLGGTKCADKNKVESAKSASKMDFVAGVIKGYQKDTAGSHESYMTAINKAKPHLDSAFSGDNLTGSSNNLAQSTTESISNNSSDTQAPVTNNIQAPQPPVWQSQQMANQFAQQQQQQQPQQPPQTINGQVLPNGFIVEPGNGQCPNGCKYPQYDNKTCEDTVLNGKQYRKCPWVKDGLNGADCTTCGAILMPKNEHGYARTAPGLFDNVSVDMAVKTTDTKGGEGDYYNIGKNFMTQLSKIKHFNLPNTIETDEYVSIGKLVHKYQTERTHSTKTTLTDFINAILVTTSLSKDKKIDNNSMITAHVSKNGGNFDIDRKKLTGKGIYAYADAEREMASDNRLGGSKSLYEKQLSDRVRKINGIPRDPRRQPNPYNSIWDVFNY